MKNNIEDFLEDFKKLIKKYEVDLEETDSKYKFGIVPGRVEEVDEEQKDNFEHRMRYASFNQEMVNRMTGRTTRLIDSYIQDLFNNIGESVKVEDHTLCRCGNKNLAYRIKERLDREHGVKNLGISESGQVFYLRLPWGAKKGKPFFYTEDGDTTTDANKAYGLKSFFPFLNINDNKDGNEI